MNPTVGSHTVHKCTLAVRALYAGVAREASYDQIVALAKTLIEVDTAMRSDPTIKINPHRSGG